MDPLFAKIQKMFLQQQKDVYGTDHIYGIDLFNELEPPSYEASYLKRVAHQVYGTLEKADKNAVWLQMTWLFYNERKDWTNDRIKAYITAYPPQKSILLDYYCERHEVWQQTDKFYNVPYIWCYLGNFGGNTMLAGNIDEVNKRIENTIQKGGKNFIGLGATLEGFDCNPFMVRRPSKSTSPRPPALISAAMVPMPMVEITASCMPVKMALRDRGS